MINLGEDFNKVFKENAFNKYESLSQAETVIRDIFEDQQGLMMDFFNLIKVLYKLSHSFGGVTDYVYEKMVKDINEHTGLREAKILTVALLLVFLNEIKDSVIKEYIHTPRDIKKEILEDACDCGGDCKCGDNCLSTVEKNIEKGFEDYSITDPALETWDEYYFNICRQAARNSKCLSRRIGAVLVRDKRIISTGYNGPPEGIARCDTRWLSDKKFFAKYNQYINTKEYPSNSSLEGVCPRRVIGFPSGEGLGVCVAGHAEENAIINCARLGFKAKDTTMYMTCGIPCTFCMIKIINAGVKEIVVTKLTYYDESSEYLLENSNIKVRVYDFILKGKKIT